MPAEAILQITLPGGGRRQVPLDTEPVLIGRDPECTVWLEDEYASRRHALIEPTKIGYVLRDEGSRNGTYVNGRRLESEHLLASGDRVRIGDFTLVFVEVSTLQGQTVFMPRRRDAAIFCDPAAREVTIRGEKADLRLSNQEFDLLSLLSARYGQVCTRDELGVAIWGTGNFEYNMLHRLVHRLKAKLAHVAPDAVVSIAGIGYKLELE
jgi:hypothetical protein